MNNQLCNTKNLTAASFLMRWIIGVLFFMAGYWKVFTLTAKVHADKFFLAAYADSWIPHWFLIAGGYIIPYWELLAGILICVGWQLRNALISVGVLLIITTYGHALATPLFDIDGQTFTRLILIIGVLVIGWQHDKSTVEFWLSTNRK